MARVRRLLIGLLAVPGIIALATCSLLPGNLEGGYIALTIGDGSAGRAIAVDHVDVDSLEITINGPGGDPLEGMPISWVPGDITTHAIPGVGTGTYEIIVAHTGSDDNGPFTVTEQADFELMAMSITRVNVIPGAVSGLVIDYEDPEPIDMTDYWIATFDFGENGYFTPVYTYMYQDGTDLFMAYGGVGSIEGSSFTVAFEGMGELTGTAGDGTASGDLAFMGLEGTYILEPTPHEYFGSLALEGEVDSVGIPYFSTDAIMAFLGDREESETGQSLSMNFMDHEGDFWVDVSTDGDFVVGEYIVTRGDPGENLKAEVGLQYQMNGEYIQVNVDSDGWVYITELTEERAVGSLTTSLPHRLEVSFNVPLTAPESADFPPE